MKGVKWGNSEFYLFVALLVDSARPCPNFTGMVAARYKDPGWEEMPLFPWMGKEALKLSEVYTAIEIDEYRGRYRKKVAIPLRDYKELFNCRKDEGTRILVMGEPGIGKTTFIHKLAYDWAMHSLDIFDVVLVVELKFADKNQSIACMIKEQFEHLWGDENVSDVIIHDYIKSGRDRVLLVLDGLDEINLKKFPQVQEVLTGQAYRKCCILATTRPYVAETLKNKMTMLANIKGFSRVKAEQFTTHILQNNAERKKFFQQLDRKKMSQMDKVPIIIQALALLYRENKQLPTTFTLTYDELVLYLRNAYRNKGIKEMKELTMKEIQEAMDEVNELAYKGLTRDDRQLVFSRDEVRNNDVFKLGLLSGEKSGTGFKPTAVLQFPHKTVQEHSAADHIVKRLKNEDRRPWEIIVKQLHGDAERRTGDFDGRPFSENYQRQSENEDQTQMKVLSTGLNKLVSAISCDPRRNAVLLDSLRQLMNLGAFDEEVDVATIWDGYKKYPLVQKVLNEEEKEVLFDIIVKEMLMETTPEWRVQQKHWVLSLDHRYDSIMTTFFFGLQVATTWI